MFTITRFARNKPSQKYAAMLLMLLSLGGCATKKAPSDTLLNSQILTKTSTWQQRQVALNQINRWELDGKMSVQTQKDAGSASLTWRQDNAAYAISFIGPLASGSMSLRGQPGLVTLTQPDGKTLTASTPEQLLSKNWGVDLPVSYLHYWIRGLPVPNVAAKTTFDNENRLSTLNQQGWQVAFLDYTTVGNFSVPRKLMIEAPQLKSKIIIRQWNIAH